MIQSFALVKNNKKKASHWSNMIESFALSNMIQSFVLDKYDTKLRIGQI